jgi:hypothetical protein
MQTELEVCSHSKFHKPPHENALTSPRTIFEHMEILFPEVNTVVQDYV